MAITAPVPAAPRTRPASTGPPTTPTPSLQLDTTFAAVSSSGVRATLGRSAACVGRAIVNGTAATIAAAYTTSGGAPASITAAVAPMPAAWPTYPATSTRPGGYRSARPANTGAAITHGASCTAATSAATVVPPCP